MLIGILLPFAGTVLGSACVFFLKSLKKKIDKLLTGFAAGVMVAASVWSLLIPAMEQSENMGRLALCAKHGTNLAGESPATGFYRQV